MALTKQEQGITNLQSYAIVVDNLMKAQMEVLEIRIENRLQEILHDFKKSLLEHFSRFKQDGSSSSMLNRLRGTGKEPQDGDIHYPHIRVEFP